MGSGYKQVTFKVDPRDYENYEEFAKRLGLSPYSMMKLLVETWAGAEELWRRLESGRTNQPEAFAELGRLIEHAQKVARLNGVFQDCMKRAAAHYGIDLKSLEPGTASHVEDVHIGDQKPVMSRRDNG